MSNGQENTNYRGRQEQAIRYLYGIYQPNYNLTDADIDQVIDQYGYDTENLANDFQATFVKKMGLEIDRNLYNETINIPLSESEIESADVDVSIHEFLKPQKSITLEDEEQGTVLKTEGKSYFDDLTAEKKITQLNAVYDNFGLNFKIDDTGYIIMTNKEGDITNVSNEVLLDDNRDKLIDLLDNEINKFSKEEYQNRWKVK